ncbi:CHASE2 domain protein [Calidithermus terrae]|uniref:CHASE2 domain protein n=1 Tax=Calidithermus terrae TaxID=1408545 RepID=A0A399DV01_9DEIN|nr:CHASE2 domain-containing protein [Calidithermus terrae]RIH75886.1 CHASE2 domain protein [Calidithermus terrae]
MRPLSRFWQSPVARKALHRTALILLVMGALQLIHRYDLLGPLGFLVDVEQNAPLDQLTRVVYRWDAPPPRQAFPPVVLVEVDRHSLEALGVQGYLFHRGRMADLLLRAAEYRPAGVLVDFDLSFGSNEQAALSEGDERLLRVLARFPYPLLLADGRSPEALSDAEVPEPSVLGRPMGRLNPQIFPVNAFVLYDSDGVTRWVPKAEPGQPLPAALALYCLGAGRDLGRPEDLEACRRLSAGPFGVGERIVFREIQRFGDGTQGEQLWKGLTVISAAEFLRGGLVRSQSTEGAVFLLGRTWPLDSDQHFVPVRAASSGLQGIDIHVNALMTLVTYGHFSAGLNRWLLVFMVPALVFVALLLTYAITDGLLGRSRFRKVINGLLEPTIIVWLLFWVGAFIVNRFGYFLDYLFPVVAMHFALLGLKVWRGAKGHDAPAD